MPALNLKQDLYVSADLPQTRRVMVKDEDLCVHCGLCAERCPTAAWDMQKFDLHLPYAGRPVPPKTLPAPASAGPSPRRLAPGQRRRPETRASQLPSGHTR